MSVKRHAICGTLSEKARHIYDVTRMTQMPEIQAFLQSAGELKRLITITKQTDSVYLEKRHIPKEYDPTGPFDFTSWKSEFIKAQEIYEHLHEDLLYTDEKQNFNDAVAAFEEIERIIEKIGE